MGGKTVGFHISGSKQWKVPQTFIQIIAGKDKNDGTTQTLNHSGKWNKLICRTLVQKVHLIPKTIAKELVKELEGSGTKYMNIHH